MADDLTTQLVRKYENHVGGTITALRAIMEQSGHINAEAMAVVADVFNISRAEVRGIVSFYTDLRTEPLGKTIIKVCQAEACQAVGSRALTKALVEKLGIALGETNDAGVSLEPVFCLGLCANGPAAMVDDNLVAFAEADSITERVT